MYIKGCEHNIGGINSHKKYNLNQTNIFPTLRQLQNSSASIVFNDSIYLQNQRKFIQRSKINYKTPIVKIIKVSPQKPKEQYRQKNQLIKEKIKNNIIRLLKSADIEQLKNYDPQPKPSSSYRRMDQYTHRGYMSYVQDQINKLQQMEKSIVPIKASQRYQNACQNLNQISVKLSKHNKKSSVKGTNKAEIKQKVIKPYKIASILLTQRPGVVSVNNNSTTYIKEKIKMRKFGSCLGNKQREIQNDNKRYRLQNINMQIKPWQLIDENF